MSSVPGRAEPPFRRVAVVGLGVMGGSLARALSADGSMEVAGWSPESAERTAAREAGAVGRAPESLEQTVEGADLVVLAVPLAATCALLARVHDLVPGAVVTDVASLKVPVEEAARAAGIGDRWVGAHPMAGSEGSGFGASREGLYREARIWVVPGAAPESRVARVEAVWLRLGGRPFRTDAAAHDRLMALASHLPQLTANALSAVLAEAGVDRDRLGPGGRDMTRLAASSPTMWHDLLARAPAELPPALEETAALLRRVAAHLRAGRVDQVDALMERTRAWTAPPSPSADGPASPPIDHGEGEA